MHIFCWVMLTIWLGTLRRQNSVLRGQFPLWTTALIFSVCTLPLPTYTLKRKTGSYILPCV